MGELSHLTATYHVIIIARNPCCVLWHHESALRCERWRADTLPSVSKQTVNINDLINRVSCATAPSFLGMIPLCNKSTLPSEP